VKVEELCIRSMEPWTNGKEFLVVNVETTLITPWVLFVWIWEGGEM
jgi:hypothetical protein